MAKLAPMRRLKARQVVGDGGPWHQKQFTTRIPIGETTVIIQVGEFHGHYKVGEGTAYWVAA